MKSRENVISHLVQACGPLPLHCEFRSKTRRLQDFYKSLVPVLAILQLPQLHVKFTYLEQSRLHLDHPLCGFTQQALQPDCSQRADPPTS